MSDAPRLYVVHCIDTEGPLTEDVAATFARLENIFGLKLEASAATLARLQRGEIDLGGREEQVARVVAPRLLQYNNSWSDVRAMLDEALSPAFRNRMVDDFGRGWTYSWHCMDHAGYSDNPRRKDLGYGNVFRFYRQMLAETGSLHDELNWHFHPLSFSRNPLQCATSYVNSYDVLMQVLCRRIVDEGWFPAANRPGFHSERPDSHAFLEQWIPFDYANQYYDGVDDGQPDLTRGRFGDWRRASPSWRGYRPAHDDYQAEGSCRRWIFRCLNVGTRFNELQSRHVEQAYEEAARHGSAILAFADHDYRDLRPDVHYVRDLLQTARGKFPGVKLAFAGAVEAARAHTAAMNPAASHDELDLSLEVRNGIVDIRVRQGTVFGPQPFLALKTVGGSYHHDNLDVHLPGRAWTYTLDEQTLRPNEVQTVAVAAAGRDGSTCVRRATIP